MAGPVRDRSGAPTAALLGVAGRHVAGSGEAPVGAEVAQGQASASASVCCFDLVHGVPDGQPAPCEQALVVEKQFTAGVAEPGEPATSLADILQGAPVRSVDPGLSVADLADRIAVGGWPAQVGRSVADSTRAARDYLEQIRQTDVGQVAGGPRDPAKVGRLLRSLARNVATEVATSVLAVDAGGADEPLARNTVADYLAVLQRLIIIEDQPAWAPHMRSKAILRSAGKRHFVDASLAVAGLGADQPRLPSRRDVTGRDRPTPVFVDTWRGRKRLRPAIQQLAMPTEPRMVSQ